MEVNLIGYLANAVGASEPAFRLLFSILTTYPMAWTYVTILHEKSPVLKNAYFTFCGVALGIFNFGFDVFHSILAVVFTYLSLRLLGPSREVACLNFAFHMSYLLMGYWLTETDTYDIKWTMPHCVLVLRLIGLSFDLWDGSKNQETLSSSNRKTALRHLPSLLEISAHVFFPASYLVGPQFSMVRLKDFVNGKLKNTNQPSSLSAGMKRAIAGLLYLLIYQVGISYLSEEYFLTEAFSNNTLIWKHIIVGIWGKLFLYKYVSCWLLTEGACITFGLAYNGSDDNKNALWDGCRNIKLGIFEGSTKFEHFIGGFNINTNNWAAQYVYKRMAFLGNRYLSQAVTLIFLALWHGLHSGYYMTFCLEFIIMYMEKELLSILNKNEFFLRVTNNKGFEIVSFVFLKLYIIIFMGFCLIPFALLSFSKWWIVYKSLYFSGFILYFPWPILYKPIVRSIFKPSKSASAAQ